jgi:hypothetical protein
MATKDISSVAAENERLLKELAAAKKERDDAHVALRAANDRGARLEGQLHDARSKLIQATERALPEAAGDALQLVESFTLVRADTGALVSAVPGDLLVLAKDGEGGERARALALRLGDGYRVYPATQPQIDRLVELGYLRS